VPIRYKCFSQLYASPLLYLASADQQLYLWNYVFHVLLDPFECSKIYNRTFHQNLIFSWMNNLEFWIIKAKKIQMKFWCSSAFTFGKKIQKYLYIQTITLWIGDTMSFNNLHRRHLESICNNFYSYFCDRPDFNPDTLLLILIKFHKFFTYFTKLSWKNYLIL
jgi:hypothetical protein